MLKISKLASKVLKCFTVTVLIALYTATNAFSQVKGKFRGGFDIIPNIAKCASQSIAEPSWMRYPTPFHMYPSINIGYNLQKNINVGIKFGLFLGHRKGEDGIHSYFEGGNITGTFTYYLNFGKIPVIPFIGGGLGLYNLHNYPHSIDIEKKAHYYMVNPSVIGAKATRLPGNQLGGFMTAGFEFGKFRVASEYNLLPAWNTEVLRRDGNNYKTTIPNSYLTISAGFYIGGGKWAELENYRTAKAAQKREKADQEIINPITKISRNSNITIGSNAVIGIGNEFTNFGISGQFQYNVTDPVRLESSFTYFLPKMPSENLIGGMFVTLAKMGVEVELSQWNFSVNGHYLFSQNDKFAIYPLAGMGIHGEKITAQGTITDGFGNREIINRSVSYSGACLNIGSGFDINLTDQFIFNCEAKYMLVIMEGELGGRFILSAGLAYRF